MIMICPNFVPGLSQAIWDRLTIVVIDVAATFGSVPRFLKNILSVIFSNQKPFISGFREPVNTFIFNLYIPFLGFP